MKTHPPLVHTPLHLSVMSFPLGFPYGGLSVSAIFVCFFIREALTCSGRDVQQIAGVLEEVEDWEALAGWLNIRTTNIRQNCALTITVAQCYRRKLVETYCSRLTSSDPYKAASGIAHELESKMKIKNIAQKLRGLKFTSVERDHEENHDSYYILPLVIALLLIIATSLVVKYCSAHSKSEPGADMPPFSIPDPTIAGLKPSMRDLSNQVIPTVCPLWRDIGLQLNLETWILNEIKANCHENVRECCFRVFEEWLKQDEETSWHVLLNACSRVRENLLSSPDKPHTKDHIKALNQLASNLPTFFAALVHD